MESELRNFIFPIAFSILLSCSGKDRVVPPDGDGTDSDIYVSVPDTSGRHGDTMAIPVIVSDIVDTDSIYSFQVTLTFDGNVLTAENAYSTGTIAEIWGTPVFNATIPGEMRIAMAGAYPLSGSGVLIFVLFSVNGSQGDTATIRFDEMVFNDGDPKATTTDGVFSVSQSVSNDPPDLFSLFFHLNHSQRCITSQPGGLYVENLRYSFSSQKSVLDGLT